MTDGSVLGHVTELRRYPVKSLGGEAVDRVEVDARGLVGDRRWAVHDGSGIGSAKTTRRFRRMEGLLDLPARSGSAGAPPVVELPDGRQLDVADPDLAAVLSDRVGREVELREEADVSHFDEGPLHLVTDASLRTLAELATAEATAARVRANLVVAVHADGPRPEEGWTGRRLRLGDELVVTVREPMTRCVTIELAQRDVTAEAGLLRRLAAHGGPQLGVVLDVVVPGTLAVGDAVTRLD